MQALQVKRINMLFFPYKADLEQWRIPIVTLLICIVCAVVMANQYQQKNAMDLHVAKFCYLNKDKELEIAIRHVSDQLGVKPEAFCSYMMTTSYHARNPHDNIKQWAFLSPVKMTQQEQQHRAYINIVFQAAYIRFSAGAPYPLTESLWFDPIPEKVSAMKMFTSAFAHADVLHLLGNLFFFFAFAATVELIIGSLSLLATVTLLALLTNSFYTLISTLNGVYVPTLGLSGVVFGLMGMFACFLPRAGVKCFFWLVVIFKRPVIPAWLLVAGYVLWNIYDWLTAGAASNVNFIVHISGALFGYLLAMIVFRASRSKYMTAATVRNVRRKCQYAQR